MSPSSDTIVLFNFTELISRLSAVLFPRHLLLCTHTGRRVHILSYRLRLKLFTFSLTHSTHSCTKRTPVILRLLATGLPFGSQRFYEGLPRSLRWSLYLKYQLSRAKHFSVNVSKIAKAQYLLNCLYLQAPLCLTIRRQSDCATFHGTLSNISEMESIEGNDAEHKSWNTFSVQYGRKLLGS